MALVVHVDGAPAALPRPVIGQGDDGGGDGLTLLVPEAGRLFPDAVGLEAVADGLVEEDASESGGDDDREFTGRGVLGR